MPIKVIKPGEYVSVSEAARLADTNDSTVHNSIPGGRLFAAHPLPAIFGEDAARNKRRMVLIRLEDLMQWIKTMEPLRRGKRRGKNNSL